MTLTSRMQSHDPQNSVEDQSQSVYATHWARQSIPRYELPLNEMPPRAAYQFIRDELALDGNPLLNLASFVTTFMEPEAEQLMQQSMSKNFIDFEEYPMTAELERRCVNMIAKLYHAPLQSNEDAVGVSTVGSSEAIILSTLAMKRRWKNRQKALGRDVSNIVPNLVMGANVQVCWEKATRYLEIEERFVYCSDDVFIMDPNKAIELVDEC